MSDLEVCAICRGHRWLIYNVERKDGRNYPEVRSCAVCNPDGKAGIGVTVYEEEELR